MNTRILLLVISIAAFSSCSSVYKSGQTPDDVYYSSSPVRQKVQSDDSYVNVRQQKAGTNYQSYDEYQDNYRDDRFLRMSVGNPYYMNSYNAYGGFDWRYNSFYDGFNYGFSSPWNNYFAWNNFYNPYSPGLYLGYGGLGFGYSSYYGGGGYYAGGGYYGGGAKGVSIAPISKPRVFNVSSYTGINRPAARTYNNSNYYNNNGNTNGNRYNNANNGGNRTNSYYNNSSNSRNSYQPSNSNNSYTPSRSYTPAAGGGGGGSCSGGGGGGVSRPSRGN